MLEHTRVGCWGWGHERRRAPPLVQRPDRVARTDTRAAEGGSADIGRGQRWAGRHDLVVKVDGKNPSCRAGTGNDDA
jgi:hypothetical protein